MKKKATVREYMTRLPITIGADQTVRFANVRMHEAGIRHLPVLDGGKLVGLVSERDLAMIEGLPGADAEALKVRDAMNEEPYAVRADAPLSQVARTLAERKLGSAVVTQDDEVVGVFTTTDALRALADALQ